VGAYPQAILGDVTLPEERTRWFGVFGTISGASLLIGLLGGGLVVDYLGPFAVFWFFAPWGLIALVLLTIFYPNRPAEKKSTIDWGGMLFLGGALACILFWCSFGGSLFGWLSPVGVLLLVGGVVFFLGLIWYERRVADPLINLKLFRNRNFTMSFSAHFLIAPMMCLCSGTLVLFGQMSLGLSATVSGTLAMPKNILFLILPTFFGAWIAKDNQRFRTAFLGCGICITVASLIASFWAVSTPVYVIYLVMIIFGIGSSCHTVAIQPYMQLAMEPENLGIATALVLFANSFGVAMVNGVYNIFYNAKYAAAMEAGGGAHLAQAIAETFSVMAVLSAICGVILAVVTVILIPRRSSPRQPLSGASR
jgi:MFS family permease